MLFSVSLVGSTSFNTSTLLPFSKSVGPILSLVGTPFALAVIVGWCCAANIVLVGLGCCQLFVHDLLQVPGLFEPFGVSRVCW